MMKEDWSKILYKDAVCKVSTTKNKLKQKEYLSSGKIPIVDQGQSIIGGYTNDEEKILKCNLPVIVFGDHTKKIKLIDFEFAPGADGIKVLEPQIGIHPKYFSLLTEILVFRIKDKGYARHYQYIEKEYIPIAPLPIQRAIVTKIENLFTSLDKGIADPACGTGGFFLASYDWIANHHDLDKEEKEFLKNKTFHGNEIVANTRRLCLMNMYLHNIGEIEGESYISPNDALVSDDGNRFDYVLTNPPFGKKSSYTVTNEAGEAEKEDIRYNRQDFWETTSNKQLNFLQHIKSMLKVTGQAAVVLPDNVLFEGGAGEEVRKQLMKTTDLHTVLRLPTGIFYAQGVKANVLFFDNRPASKDAQTKDIWFYDYRTNVHHTLKKKPMNSADLEDFVKHYNPRNRHKRTETWSEENPEGRWRRFTYKEILERDKTNLDIFWLRDKSLTDLDNLPDPDLLAAEIIENIESGLNSFKEIMGTLNGNSTEREKS